MRIVQLILFSILPCLVTILAKQPVAKYRPLPSLQEQHRLESGWVQQRHELIPSILKKQCVEPPPHDPYPCISAYQLNESSDLVWV